MQTVEVKLESISPYSQSKFIDVDAIPKLGKEGPDAYEKRVWKNRVHLDEKGFPFMPPLGLKKSLEAAAPYSGVIPGQGKSTYTKRIKSGILITDPITLEVAGKKATADDWKPEWLFLDAQGKNGDKRVKRCMPRLGQWTASVTIYVVDEILTKDVLQKILNDAGMLVGVGRFRPQNGGFYGRFKATITKVTDQ